MNTNICTICTKCGEKMLTMDTIDAEQELQILLLVPNFRNQLLGVEYLMDRFNLQNDKYLQPIYEEIAKNIQTPSQEWIESFDDKYLISVYSECIKTNKN